MARDGAGRVPWRARFRGELRALLARRLLHAARIALLSTQRTRKAGTRTIFREYNAGPCPTKAARRYRPDRHAASRP